MPTLSDEVQDWILFDRTEMPDFTKDWPLVIMPDVNNG